VPSDLLVLPSLDNVTHSPLPGNGEPDPATPDPPRAHRWRRKPRKPETRAARRARLDRAAGEAIAQAAETNGDPIALMAAASGTEAKYCDPIIRQHPLFFSALRARFLMPEEMERMEREARIAAAAAAEPGPVVWVRRRFNDRRSRRAAYRFADVSGLHWSSRSGGKKRHTNRPYLHGYVRCDAMLVGAVAHSCRQGPAPHRIKVCLTRSDNKQVWPQIERAAYTSPGRPGAEKEQVMTNGSTLSLPEMEDRIAILRDNIRQLTEQAAALSGAADEARAADRIAAQQADLDRLVAERDAILARRAAAARLAAPKAKRVKKKKVVKKKSASKKKKAARKKVAKKATKKKKRR